MHNPHFSVIIPSRNRATLLRQAILSIISQDYCDFEIIVSDNASDSDYRDLFQDFNDFNIRFLRSEEPLSVTDNWNKALEAAVGEYVIMLGDDDALTPGLLRRLAALIVKFETPDVIYLMAYHYAYPGVFDTQQDGYFCVVNNSPLFDTDSGPFLLDPAWARELGRQALNFRHKVSFNAQHFIYRRIFVEKLDVRPFYQSPYPDYFACFVTFMTAERIVVVPSPEVIIGISKKSFGFYLAKDKEAEGLKEFRGADLDVDALSRGDARIRHALEHLGSAHIRNWLVASLFAKRALGKSCDVDIDLRRYCRIQTFELASRAASKAPLGRSQFWRNSAISEEIEREYGRKLLWLFTIINRTKALNDMSLASRLSDLLGVYHTPKIYMIDIGSHRNIMDAVSWLEPPRSQKGGVVDGLLEADSTRKDAIAMPNSEVAPKDIQIPGLIALTRELKIALTERDAEFVATLAKRDESIAELTVALGERDESIAGLTVALGERDKSIADLTATLAERGEAIEQLTTALAKRDGALEDLRINVEAYNAELNQLRTQLASFEKKPFRTFLTQGGHLIARRASSPLRFLRRRRATDTEAQ
jgi:glycosyltransferase involved in cell wall biosynthesis